jgi:hypothetical protein
MLTGRQQTAAAHVNGETLSGDLIAPVSGAVPNLELERIADFGTAFNADCRNTTTHWKPSSRSSGVSVLLTGGVEKLRPSSHLAEI